MAQFKILEHELEDGAEKVFAHLRQPVTVAFEDGERLTEGAVRGVAGDIVEVANEVTVHVLDPLLEAVDADARALVAEARKLLGEAPQTPPAPAEVDPA